MGCALYPKKKYDRKGGSLKFWLQEKKSADSDCNIVVILLAPARELNQELKSEKES